MANPQNSLDFPQSYRQPLAFLLAVLAIKALVVVWLIIYGSIGLGPDEAQYWTWSQQLDFGYYSKPPGIAWQIWLGTQIFGNTELGVRSGALIIGTLIPIAVFYLAKACRLQPKTCFWTAVAMALSPLGWMSTFLAITDGGLVLFWALATLVVCKAMEKEQAMPSSMPWYRIGACILCGALFKWPIYLFWLFPIGLYVTKSLALKDRKTIPPHLFGGIAFSFLGLLPSIAWNLQYDWPTFRHVLATVNTKETIDVGTTVLSKGNFWDFIGAQALLISPILFLLLCLGFIQLFRERGQIVDSLKFCSITSFSILCFYCIISLFKKMQGNWCDFAYPAAFVVLSWVACERIWKGRYWMAAGVSLSIALVAALFTLFIYPMQSLALNSRISYKIHPFKHNIGWKTLSTQLQKAGYNPKEHFLFADKYQTSSILSFYGPSQKRAYFLNLQKMRKNQFSYWPGMEIEQKGRTGFFVLTENSPYLERGIPTTAVEYQRVLEHYFEEVQFLGIKPLYYHNGEVVKAAYIYKCIDYNGKVPAESHTY